MIALGSCTPWFATVTMACTESTTGPGAEWVPNCRSSGVKYSKCRTARLPVKRDADPECLIAGGGAMQAQHKEQLL